MYCSKCGKEIPEESVFCPECGNRCKLSADKENKEIDTKENNIYFNNNINYATNNSFILKIK